MAGELNHTSNVSDHIGPARNLAGNAGILADTPFDLASTSPNLTRSRASHTGSASDCTGISPSHTHFTDPLP